MRLPLMFSRQRVELHPNVRAALLLHRLDERPADIAVLHESVAVRDPRRVRVALRRGNTGLGNRHHHVGRARRLAREFLAHALPGEVDALAIEVRVGPRDVDELEDAELRLGLGEADRTHARRVDRDQFAGLDVAHEMRADDIERAGFAGQHPAAFRATEYERAEPVRVAHAEEVRFVHQHERERAGQLRQHLLAAQSRARVRRRGRRAGTRAPGAHRSVHCRT